MPRVLMALWMPRVLIALACPQASHEQLDALIASVGDAAANRWEARVFFEWFIVHILDKHYRCDAEAPADTVDWSQVTAAA